MGKPHTTPWKGKERIREGRDYPAIYEEEKETGAFIDCALQKQTQALPAGQRYGFEGVALFPKADASQAWAASHPR